MAGGRLVIMGSGETAPTMVEVHRSVLAPAAAGPVLILDTPYGFQENADSITTRAAGYLGRSVRRRAVPLQWRSRPAGAELDRALHAVRTAVAVFAGPGSPTYALRQWSGTGFADALVAAVAAGATVTFSSAAALTLGSCTLPVYEIYKCGQEPYWVPGMDVLAQLTGLHAAVIPHYDNAEGGTHDTRYCYLGERRLQLLEQGLAPGARVLGVDEHTALVLEPEAGTARVLGRGAVTVRVAGRSRTLPAGTVTPISTLGTADDGLQPPDPAPLDTGSLDTEPLDPAGAGSSGPTSLRTAADAARVRFDTAIAARDAEGAAQVVLELEEALHEWASDTFTSGGVRHARSVLRGMVLALADAARSGLADPRERLAPALERLLALRATARGARDYATSDAIRDALGAAAIRLRDTPAGTEWDLD